MLQSCFDICFLSLESGKKTFCRTLEEFGFFLLHGVEAWGRERCIFQFYHIFCPAFIPVQNSCCFVQWLSPLLLALEQIRPVRGTFPVTGNCSPGSFASRWRGSVPACQHWRGELSALDFCKNFFCLIPCGAKGDFSHKRAHSFTGLCSSYENYCKNWQQLIEFKILFLSQSKFLFQNKLWNRGWNRSQTTWKWTWRVYCLSSKDLCRAITWVQDHGSIKKIEK